MSDSQGRKGAAVVHGKADQRQRAGVLNAYEVRKCNKRTVKRSNRPVVSGKREDCPAETPWCGKSRGDTCQILNAVLHNRVLCSVTQGQEHNCRIVRVRCKGSSIDDSVPGVPAAVRAGTIKQHLDPKLNAERNFFQPAARASELV